LDFDNSYDKIIPGLQTSITIGGTSSLIVPVGTLAQQPASGSSSIGMLRYDSSSSKLEMFDGSWENVATEAFISTNYVSNTSLGSWTGNTFISSVGTIAFGTWTGVTIATAHGGTGITSIGAADQVLATNHTATGLEYKTITAGAGITVTPAVGSITIASTGVTSVGLSAPSIFTVSGSPVTTTGTLSLSLNAQAANTMLAGPTSGSAATPTFRTISLAGKDVADVTISSPTAGQVLTYNGSAWVNSAQAAISSNVISAWSFVSGNLYSATINHGLGTNNVVVECWNEATNQQVKVDSVTIIDANRVTVIIAGGSTNIRCVVVAGGSNTNATTISSWTLVSGNLYSATFTHGLNTQNIIVNTLNAATGQLVQVDSVTIVDGNNVTIVVAGNTTNIKCIVTAGGTGISTGAWTPAAGNLYSTNIAHGLGTTSLIVQTWSAANVLTVVDSITVVDNNNITVTAVGNTNTFNCVILTTEPIIQPANTTILRTLSYYASSLDTPNSSDWVVNSLAAAIADPVNSALTVREFSNVTEQGVGCLMSIPPGATYITFLFKGRAQTAPGATSIVQPKLYVRSIPNNAAVGAWSSAYNMSNIAIPPNAYFQYSSQTYSLSALGMSAPNLYQVELTRSTTVAIGTQLPSMWFLAEFTVEFM